jgi:pimeloyl-ACP methyl ester carboxylesterase/protein-tyrosine phosphatase
VASCLAVDLPGCGLSTFEPTAWGAYTTEALVQLLAVVIEAHRNAKEGQSIIIVGHSMGCSLAALLASPSSPYAHLISNHVDGLVAICPQAEPPTEKQVKVLRGVTSIPAIFFDIFRKWDRRGGVNSKSVLRMTGAGADEETKRLQLRYNKQSRTSAWQRIARGMCPDYSSGSPKGGLPGKDVWAGLKIPVFLAAGEADQVTATSNVKRIVEFLGRDVSTIQPPSEKASLPIAAAPFDPARVRPSKDLPAREHQDSGVDAGDLPTSVNDGKTMETTSVTTADGSLATTEDVSTEGSVTTADGPLISDSTTPSFPHPSPYPRRLVVKTLILPTPAAHSLLFAPSSSRILAGLVGNFFKDHIDPRLYLAWQLSHLTVEGKWDVKNLEKWEKVPPVSAPIANVFRAMKTLREVDQVHTPKVLVKQLQGQLSAVIDISHDNPVYNPKGLEDGGIPYHKFPTVSKHPPPPRGVKQFIELVNRIRAEGRQGLIGVHCHYGFNRTGFFLVCYLVEEEGWRVEDAIDAFQRARPPGIRHPHFIDALHVRYAVGGLKRAPTL